MCSETFPKESALVLHTKKHYYPFECSICARFSIGYRNINCKFYEFGMASLIDVVSGMKKISTHALARKIKTEGEVLRHEATHVESTLRRTTTSLPTRNRDLVTLPPEKQPIVKNSLFDVQNPLLPQILDDAICEELVLHLSLWCCWFFCLCWPSILKSKHCEPPALDCLYGSKTEHTHKLQLQVPAAPLFLSLKNTKIFKNIAD